MPELIGQFFKWYSPEAYFTNVFAYLVCSAAVGCGVLCSYSSSEERISEAINIFLALTLVLIFIGLAWPIIAIVAAIGILMTIGSVATRTSGRLFRTHNYLKNENDR